MFLIETATISVTKEDIKRGVPGNGESCPVALAIRRAINNNYVMVHTSGCFAGNLCYFHRFSSKQTRFIESFDTKGVFGVIMKFLFVRPMSFEIRYAKDVR